MKLSFLILLFTLVGHSTCFTQNDTLNQRDENGMKQGYWIYYGTDLPEKGYQDSAKIFEGSFLNDRKEGLWISYNLDGSIRTKGAFKNNRPIEPFKKVRPPHPVNEIFNEFSSCTEKAYDSIEVKFNHSNSYGPATDSSIIIYNNNHQHSEYIDSISRLDKIFQTPIGLFCSHIIDIRIWRYLDGQVCSSRFTTCQRKRVAANIAKDCAERVFGF